jgi:hypothetical protein
MHNGMCYGRAREAGHPLSCGFEGRKGNGRSPPFCSSLCYFFPVAHNSKLCVHLGAVEQTKILLAGAILNCTLAMPYGTGQR